jgi:glyoxylase-like metal-dependent hydrolase (beta-lactamase superfamily II)
MTPLTLQVGALRLHLLSDGVYWTDGGAAFGVVPRTLWGKIIEPDALNRIPMQLRCLLIETEDGPMLVDTGYGDTLSDRQRQQIGIEGEKRLLGDLAAVGYRPEDIRTVICTHLHADHCGGNTRFDADGDPVPTFPNAQYLVQRLELADATFPNERTRNAYFRENFLLLSNLCRDDGSHQMRILTGDTQVTPEVRTLITPGHTRAHQSVIVESQGQTAIFLADAAAWAVSLERLAWVPAFDVEPLVSMETKRSLRDWAWRTGALLLFQHDTTLAAGRLRKAGEEWRVEPVSAATTVASAMEAP